MKIIKGQLVDLHQKIIYPAEIKIDQQRIKSIRKIKEAPAHYIMPGFVDAHVHIESSMLIPSEFARLAVVHGTVGTVSDPHEIGNVMGIMGIRFMINNAKQTNFKINFGVPPCVPATQFETAGATITPEDVDTLFKKDGLKYMTEFMNWPGVLNKDEDCVRKLDIAKAYGKPIDGHAPGLKGEQAKAYADAGISTDHECFTYQEGLDKIQAGMKVQIREGSAAKNFEALVDLLKDHPEQVMFCCDDKHPDNLIENHLNDHVKRALAKGHDLFDVLRAASYNAIKHYDLDIGLLQEGDPADLIIVDNLEEFNIQKTYINGELVAEHGTTLLKSVPCTPINNFSCAPKVVEDFAIPASAKKINVIECLEGELITNALTMEAKIEDGQYVSDTERDVLKMVVVNRYKKAPVAKAFIKNFGLKKGAIASSVAHDSHNIIAVGTDDESLCRAVNIIIESRGGVCAFDGEDQTVLPLPVAGLMTNINGYEAAQRYMAVDKMVKAMGGTLNAPFMTLSFMALLVIPSLKLSDKGLFDGDQFCFTDLAKE
ncbi:adenine deaminase [Persicobacter psychrovividus]|uniref:Adenine deaminase n=1 Tax=Persicobacter psychrovividus TaxID=387638 RepID=A0ABN6L953_9BACT|nr:adenine deaminase [Persicobacter psychrovividus]